MDFDKPIQAYKLTPQENALHAAGYLAAARDVREQAQLHGADFDRDMLLHFLEGSAELRVAWAKGRLGLVGPVAQPVAAISKDPRLLDCGLCYEEDGEEIHPHPECPIGAAEAPVSDEELALKYPQAVAHLNELRDRVRAQRLPVPLEPQSRQLHGAQVAYRIRAEFVCCDVYGRINDGVEPGKTNLAANAKDRIRHDLCYWGEACARIAENPALWQADPDACAQDCPKDCRHTRTGGDSDV